MSEFSLEEWVNAEHDTFDLSKEYEEQIVPLIDALHTKCRELNMPFYERFVTVQNGKASEAMVSHHLGGPTRATKELITCVMLENVRMESVDQLLGIIHACRAKYNKPEEGDPVH